MNKVLGYSIIGIGLVVFALSYPKIRSTLGIPSIGLSDNVFLIVGLIGIVVGAFFITKGSSAKQPPEVPVYEGEGKNRKIIAYQRVKK